MDCLSIRATKWMRKNQNGITGLASSIRKKGLEQPICVLAASLVTVITRIDKEPVVIEADIERAPRTFVHVDTALGTGYRRTSAALNNATERRCLLIQARNDMKLFASRYAALDEWQTSFR
jgi:hypothetical protein